MKKGITFLTTICLLTASASSFARQTVAEVMAHHKEMIADKGLTFATLKTTSALVENKISSQELREYLAFELSPKDLRKVDDALEQGLSAEELNTLALDISNGANFKGNSCYSTRNQILLWGGSIATIYLAVQANNRKKDAKEIEEANKRYIETQEYNILNLQNQIKALRNEGVSPTSYLITTREAEISEAQFAILQTQRDTKPSELRSSSDLHLKAALGAGAVTSVAFLLCDGKDY
jgi:hypothetical protein